MRKCINDKFPVIQREMNDFEENKKCQMANFVLLMKKFMFYPRAVPLHAHVYDISIKIENNFLLSADWPMESVTIEDKK